MTAASDRITTFPNIARAEDLISNGRFEEAATFVIQHLRAHPNDARGYALLGSVAMNLGALMQAEQFLRKSMALGNNNVDTLRSLAANLNQQERLPEALEIFDRLEKLTDDPTLSATRALILDKLGQSDEAIDVLEKLVARVPDHPPYLISYGHALRYAGRTDDAISAYRLATVADEEIGEAWWGLANIKSKVLTDDDLATMKRVLTVAIDPRNTAPLHFSLARGWHDRKQYELAFHHYTEGNRIRAEQIGYLAKELSEEVDEYVRLYDHSFFEQRSSLAVAGPIPVFIVSLPRSGSTLLEQMLGSHPDVDPAGELPFIPALLRTVMEQQTRRARVTVPGAIMRLSDDEAAALGREYLQRAATHHQSGVRGFVDKLPHNWSNILFIRRILPQAKFIDIRRSAMDCCFSNFTQSFSRAHAASFALNDIGQCYVDYVRLMDQLDRVAPGLVHHVRYEQLIEQPEPELRAIFDYLGIEWSDEPLNFHKLDRVVRTPSAEQVRRPLNREGVGVWKPYEQWLGPLREVLGPLADT